MAEICKGCEMLSEADGKSVCLCGKTPAECRMEEI